MKKIFILLSCLFSTVAFSQNADLKDAQQTETIVLIRHAEKPKGGLGQLSCKGLNRALALPKVLLNKFGRPQYIFAPNPSEKVDDAKYFYVRPLMTIEPTAIACGLPVNTAFGYLEIEALQNELLEPQYSNATIFIAWEHGLQDAFARRLVHHFGNDAKVVPDWSNDEYDMIFVFQIKTDGNHKTLSFSIDHERLNDVDTACPL